MHSIYTNMLIDTYHSHSLHTTITSLLQIVIEQISRPTSHRHLQKKVDNLLNTWTYLHDIMYLSTMRCNGLPTLKANRRVGQFSGGAARDKVGANCPDLGARTAGPRGGWRGHGGVVEAPWGARWTKKPNSLIGSTYWLLPRLPMNKLQSIDAQKVM